MSFACDLGRFFNADAEMLQTWTLFLGGGARRRRTFFWLIRPSGEGCPCQEGGQGTNSFLFRDTSIYQARLHTPPRQVCICVCGFFFVCLHVDWRKGEGHMMRANMCTGHRQTGTFQGDPMEVGFLIFFFFLWNPLIPNSEEILKKYFLAMQFEPWGWVWRTPSTSITNILMQ